MTSRLGCCTLGSTVGVGRRLSTAQDPNVRLADVGDAGPGSDRAVMGTDHRRAHLRGRSFEAGFVILPAVKDVNEQARIRQRAVRGPAEDVPELLHLKIFKSTKSEFLSGAP